MSQTNSMILGQHSFIVTRCDIDKTRISYHDISHENDGNYIEIKSISNTLFLKNGIIFFSFFKNHVGGNDVTIKKFTNFGNTNTTVFTINYYLFFLLTIFDNINRNMFLLKTETIYKILNYQKIIISDPKQLEEKTNTNNYFITLTGFSIKPQNSLSIIAPKDEINTLRIVSSRDVSVNYYYNKSSSWVKNMDEINGSLVKNDNDYDFIVVIPFLFMDKSLIFYNLIGNNLIK